MTPQKYLKRLIVAVGEEPPEKFTIDIVVGPEGWGNQRARVLCPCGCCSSVHHPDPRGRLNIYLVQGDAITVGKIRAGWPFFPTGFVTKPTPAAP